MPSFPLTWPAAFKIRSSTFGLDVHTTSFSSDFSGMDGISERNSGVTNRWAGSYSLVPQTPTANAELLAFLATLRGREGTFLAFDPDRKQPSTKNGAFPGNGTVNSAGQSGRTLNTDGWPGSSLILKAGDLVQVGSQLLEIAADVTSDMSGLATLTFEPALRVSPPDGEDVITGNPAMVARLKESSFYLETKPMVSIEKTIKFEEVI